MRRTFVKHSIFTVFTTVSLIYSATAQGAAITWDAGGGGNQNWSEPTNFSDDASPAGDVVTFNNTGTSATTGTVTNIVDSSVSLAALNYSNTGATNTHTTQINTNQTLTVATTGPNFSIGSSGVTKVNFTGGGKLVVTDLNQLIGNVSGGTTVVDMSQLNTYSTSGAGFFSGPAFGASHTVTMAATNFWQVGQFRIHSSFSNNNSFKLGQTNTIQIATDDFQLGTGGGSTGNTIGFMAGLSGTPTLKIRGYNGGTNRAPAGMYIGQQSSNSSIGTSMTMDLTAAGGTDGSIDALLTSLVIGDKTDLNDNTGAGTGALIYDQGTVDAVTVTLGRIAGTGVTVAAAASNGSLTVGGSGTLIANTINFGTNAGSGSARANGTLNVSGGTIQATTMQPGVGSATTRVINFNSGKIQNKSGGDLTIASGLTLNSLTAGTHTFEADATRSITVNSALVGAGTGDVVKAGAGTVNFNAANTYAGNTNITAGTLALGASGTITNNSVITVGTTGSSGTVLDVTAKSSFAIGATQTLKGIGNVNIGAGKTVTINGTLAPGNSIGADSVTGNLTLAGTSSFELGTAGASHASPGTSDRTDVTGDLALGGTLTLVDNAGAGGNGSFGPGSYKIFTYGSASGSLSGSFSTINNIGTTHAKIVDGGAGTGSGQGVFLDAYRLASASAHTPEPVSFGTVLVGTALSQSLSLTNNATNDGFSEGLNASIGGATGNATTNGGSFSVLAAGSTNNSSLSAGINTATAGSKSGTATITLNSNGTGTSGFGTTSLGTQTVNLTATVLDAALASFLATPLTTTLNVGIGSFAQGSGSHTAGFSIFNLLQTAGFTADLSLVALPIVGADDANLSTDLATFNNLLAGSSNSFLATLTTANAGSFSEQYDLQLRSTGFASDTIQHLTLNISGSVVPVPEPSAFITMLLGTCGLWLVRRKR